MITDDILPLLSLQTKSEIVANTGLRPIPVNRKVVLVKNNCDVGSIIAVYCAPYVVLYMSTGGWQRMSLGGGKEGDMEW